MSNIKVSIITIGDELLIGQTIDTNSAWIAQKLNALGIDVIRRVAVGDDKLAITSALDEELSKSAIVLITGGLGPTADDITKPLLCEYFGGKLVVDEIVLAHIVDIFTRRNRPFLDRNMKQAELPDNCTVLFNKMGTAPGMWFDKDGKIIIAMPGVPFEMMSIMEDEVLPRFEKQFISDALLHYSVITAGEGESFIAEKIQDIEESLPVHIKLAYLPGAGNVKLRLTGRGKDPLALSVELDKYQKQLAERLRNIVVALEDIPMEQVIAKILLEKNASIGFAESCTGGNLGHLITQIPGATDFFCGSIVSYREEIKKNVLGVKQETLDNNGVISEQTAIEMVQGAIRVLNCDYALSVTGLLGPASDDDEVEVGTVWMAVADKAGTIKTKKFRFYYDRLRNKEMAVQAAFRMIHKFLLGDL